MFNIFLSKEADKFLSKLDNFKRGIVIKRIEKLADNPYALSKKLVGNEFWSLRVGKEFRVIFRVEKNDIEIAAIGYRRNIYDKI